MIQNYHKGLTLLMKIMNIDLSFHQRKWCQIYEHRCKHRGKADSIKFVKELNTICERYALRQNITPLAWTRSDRDGFPTILGSTFKSKLRSSNPLEVIMVLSITRSCELLRLPISKDISTVTQKCCYDENLMKEILAFIPEWIQRVKPNVNFPDMKYHYTVKNGPNGPALLASDSDIVAVMKDPKLYEAIRTVEDQLNDDRPMISMPHTCEVSPIHSKLTQFPEKAGKTRTIAVIDYYSQRCLKPLHKCVMDILASLVSDGTYSHQNVGKFAQMKTKEKSYIFCADLTAFTDRFPAIIQRVLLDELVQNPILSQAWWTLLAERTFKLAWSDELVTYQCGQPMGAYASWPLCSLAHHLIVEFSAFRVGTKQIKDKYRLIGDDVIITDEKTAQEYQKIILSLGIDINFGKTVESAEASNYSGAEVAKQLYLNGTCLSPVTPGFIRDLRKPYMLNTSMKVLRDRYEFFTDETPARLIDQLFDIRKNKKHWKKSWLLCSNPISGVIKPGNPGYDESAPWALYKRDWQDDYFTIVAESMADKAFKATEENFKRLMNRASPSELGTNTLPSCIEYVSNDINNQLSEILEEISYISMEDFEDILTRFDFIPDPNAPYRDRRETRQRRVSSVIEKLFNYEEPDDIWTF